MKIAVFATLMVAQMMESLGHSLDYKISDEEVKAAFRYFDYNGDNGILSSELFAGAWQLDVDADGREGWLTKKEANKKVRVHDRDNDGKLNFREFDKGQVGAFMIRNTLVKGKLHPSIQRLLKEKRLLASAVSSGVPSDKRVREEFLSMDWDDNEFITADELNVMSDHYHPVDHPTVMITEEEAQERIGKFDKDGDGKLNKKEFYAGVKWRCTELLNERMCDQMLFLDSVDPSLS